MALSIDLNGDSTMFATAETTFPNVYCRACSPVGMNRDVCNIRVEFWLSEAVAQAGGKQPLLTQSFNAPGVSDPVFQAFVVEAEGDIIRAMYLWLKTQPEFEGALDV